MILDLSSHIFDAKKKNITDVNLELRWTGRASENKRESQEHLRRVFFYGYISGLLYNIGERYDVMYFTCIGVFGSI